MDEFAVNLHRRLPAAGNLVWSPYSVASALGLLAAGARGRTHDELVRVLGTPPSGLRPADAAAPRGVRIAVANTLWARAGSRFEEAYERAVAGLPGAALRVADFAADAERARQAINTDVEKVTRGLIRDLLAPGTIDASTAAVLVNALYLRAAWQGAFAERDTRPGAFHTPGGRRDVPMMRRTGRMPYAESGGHRMVSLATEGEVVVDVLVGQDGATPSPELLRGLRGSARPVKVELSLPRFRIESTVGLHEALGALGVRTAFGDDADFSGAVSTRLRVDRVEHKAVLEVDEAGFEGAAATAVVMALAAFDMSRAVEFRVDRPFLVFVRHPASEAVYFAARVTDPGAGR